MGKIILVILLFISLRGYSQEIALSNIYGIWKVDQSSPKQISIFSKKNKTLTILFGNDNYFEVEIANLALILKINEEYQNVTKCIGKNDTIPKSV